MVGMTQRRLDMAHVIYIHTSILCQVQKKQKVCMGIEGRPVLCPCGGSTAEVDDVEW